MAISCACPLAILSDITMTDKMKCHDNCLAMQSNKVGEQVVFQKNGFSGPLHVVFFQLFVRKLYGTPLQPRLNSTRTVAYTRLLLMPGVGCNGSSSSSIRQVRLAFEPQQFPTVINAVAAWVPAYCRRARTAT